MFDKNKVQHVEIGNRISLEEAQAVQLAVSMGLNVPIITQARAMAAVVQAAGISQTPVPTGEWQPGEYVTPGCIRTHEGTDYRCIQAHITQPHWTPLETPMLWQPE
jgi:hypothetical protein